ncbi:glycine-rich protein [Leptolyngbya sp. NIES-2104]|uniref:glycine-rich protein n=1 Tax=Leptolyngbya sp. NIES-2104 TaxID=1552121 RepID=UPI0006EC8368|nr:glycine-rich protein [Leptolyngbya sp. NIES-2104]GAP95955.1 hypothetical protein NIES2104_24840 [Leptolyngbya sp. NIES-2104]
MKLALLGAVAAGVAYATPAAALQTFNFTGSLQSWTVPITGTYTITTFGAQGGNRVGLPGGLGGRTGADFNLAAGQTISILVGGQGGNSNVRGSGGGGGTFVA